MASVGHLVFQRLIKIQISTTGIKVALPLVHGAGRALGLAPDTSTDLDDFTLTGVDLFLESPRCRLAILRLEEGLLILDGVLAHLDSVVRDDSPISVGFVRDGRWWSRFLSAGLRAI